MLACGIALYCLLPFWQSHCPVKEDPYELFLCHPQTMMTKLIFSVGAEIIKYKSFSDFIYLNQHAIASAFLINHRD